MTTATSNSTVTVTVATIIDEAHLRILPLRSAPTTQLCGSVFRSMEIGGPGYFPQERLSVFVAPSSIDSEAYLYAASSANCV